MPDALNGILYRFFVDNLPLSESDEHAEPLFYHALEHFNLHLSHELDMDFLQLAVPHDMELGFLFLNLPQVRQHRMGVAAVRQFDAVSQHRLQDRDIRVFFRPDSLSGMGLFQPGHRTDHPCVRALHRLVFLSGIDAYLIDLSFHPRKSVFDLQRPAGNFQISQPVPLVVSGNLVHLRAELCRVRRPRRQSAYPVQKLPYPPGLQR